MEKWQSAYEDFKQGKKYKEIAEKYGVSEGTVKSWASRKWKKEKQKEVATLKEKMLQPNKEKLQPNKERLQSKTDKHVVSAQQKKRKPGGQKGNQNAVGNKGGAPKGNQNNYHHGIYSKLIPDLLTEEEKEILNHAYFLDALKEMKHEVAFNGIRMAYLYKKMAEAANKPGGLVLDSVEVTKFQDKTENDISGQTKPKEKKEVTKTKTVSTDEVMLKCMAEIDKISNQRLKGLDLLYKYELEMERFKSRSTKEMDEAATITIRIGDKNLE